MATAFTHAFVGVALAQGLPAEAPRTRLVTALALAAVFPDLDVLTFGWRIPYSHMFGHRGFFHSPAFALVLALLAAWWALPPPLRRGRVARRVVALLFAAAASHGILDAFTDAGLGIAFFAPVSGERFFFPWRFLVTPSVSPSDFFGSGAVPILKSEGLYVWLPVVVLSILFQACKRALSGERLRRRPRG